MQTRSQSALLVLALIAAGLVVPLQADGPSATRLTFIKVFKGSYPEYIHVTLEENGRAIYQGGSADDPGEPEPLQLSPQFAGQAFALAAQLQYFQDIQLETERRVAFMGKKTFIYQKDGRRAEVSYNYTTNQSAEELREMFENLARCWDLVGQLEHGLVFDRLGLMDTLRKFESQFNAGRLTELQLAVPVLEKIAADTRLMQLAQTRARSLLGRVRGEPAALNLEYGDQQANRYYKMLFVEGGAVTFEARRFDEPARPVLVELPPAVVERVWQVIRVAGYFEGLADYQEPFGRLSGYRFTYESGPAHHQVAFSSPPTAAVGELVHVFQQALQQEHYRERLQAAVAEKSFMLQVVLQEMEKALARDDLINPKEFAPVLEDISRSEGQHEIVRAQAQRLLATIRGAQP